MNANPTMIDIAMDLCRTVLPESLSGRLGHRLTEWRCERGIEQLAELHRIEHPAGSELAPDKTREWADCFSRTASKLRSYRTQIEMRDILGADAERAQPDLTWIGTVVLPDRFHVRQSAGDDYDEWLTIGNATWESLAVMLGCTEPGIDSRRSLTNQQLLIDRWLQATFLAPPHSGWSFPFRGRSMAHLAWAALPPESTVIALGGDPRPEHPIPAVSLDVWLLGDGRFARADLKMTDDDGYRSVLTQRVAMHNYPFAVHDPGRRSS